MATRNPWLSQKKRDRPEKNQTEDVHGLVFVAVNTVS